MKSISSTWILQTFFLCVWFISQSVAESLSVIIGRILNESVSPNLLESLRDGTVQLSKGYDVDSV